MAGDNPYKAPAGPETDRAIHQRYFTAEGTIYPYSTNEEAALKVKSRITTVFGHPVQTGQTHTRPRRYFARFDSGPSTATEVLAETLPLSICRLALVVASARDPAAR